MQVFEFDENKSQSNRKKHGIDFAEAQNLWADPDLIEIQARLTDEPRSLFIGLIKDKVWAAVTTYRDKAIRIISVRRARQSEIDIYES